MRLCSPLIFVCVFYYPVSAARGPQTIPSKTHSILQILILVGVCASVCVPSSSPPPHFKPRLSLSYASLPLLCFSIHFRLGLVCCRSEYPLIAHPKMECAPAHIPCVIPLGLRGSPPKPNQQSFTLEILLSSSVFDPPIPCSNLVESSSSCPFRSKHVLWEKRSIREVPSIFY